MPLSNLGLLWHVSQRATQTQEAIWYSVKRAGVKRACPNKVMAHMWSMHDAYLGHAFTVPWYSGWLYIAVNDSHAYSMSLVCSLNEVGDVLCQVSSSPFCMRPFWRMPSNAQRIAETCTWFASLSVEHIWSNSGGQGRCVKHSVVLRCTPVCWFTSLKIQDMLSEGRLKGAETQPEKCAS